MLISDKIDEMIDMETDIQDECKLYHAYYAELCTAIENGIPANLLLSPQVKEEIDEDIVKLNDYCDKITTCINNAMVSDEIAYNCLKQGMMENYQNIEQSVLASVTEVNMLCGDIRQLLGKMYPNLKIAIDKIRELS